MNKITIYPFKVSAGLFGAVSLLTSIIYALVFNDNIFRSDDPYIIGFVLACITSLASLIYLLLKELNLKWLNPNYCIAIYFALLAAYCLFIEYIGGEAAGYGYFFLTSIALSLPAFLAAVVHQRVNKVIKYGIASGLIYLIGYIYVLSSHI